MPNYYTVTEFGTAVGLSRFKVNKMIENGLIKAETFGHRKFIPVQEVDRYVSEVMKKKDHFNKIRKEFKK